jgi:hypothetical protein
VKNVADEVLTNLWSIAICGIYKVDAESREALEDPARFRRISRWPPNATPRNPHSAEAEPMDWKLATNEELAGSGGNQF